MRTRFHHLALLILVLAAACSGPGMSSNAPPAAGTANASDIGTEYVEGSATPDGIGKPYRRYLSNRLRDSFDLDGTPVRMVFRRKRKLDDADDK